MRQEISVQRFPYAPAHGWSRNPAGPLRSSATAEAVLSTSDPVPFLDRFHAEQATFAFEGLEPPPAPRMSSRSPRSSRAWTHSRATLLARRHAPRITLRALESLATRGIDKKERVRLAALVTAARQMAGSPPPDRRDSLRTPVAFSTCTVTEDSVQERLAAGDVEGAGVQGESVERGAEVREWREAAQPNLSPVIPQDWSAPRTG